MTSVKFLAFRDTRVGNLTPAPNVLEAAEIAAACSKDTSPRLEPHPDALMNKVLKVLTHYRGNLLFLEGGIAIHRFDPKTCVGNGYAMWPSPGLVEEVHVEGYTATVEFI